MIKQKILNTDMVFVLGLGEYNWHAPWSVYINSRTGENLTVDDLEHGITFNPTSQNYFDLNVGWHVTYLWYGETHFGSLRQFDGGYSVNGMPFIFEQIAFEFVNNQLVITAK